MIYEKSCGAVIFFRRDGEPLYLVEQMRLGHVSICKGHVEAQETEHETAAREIREETALSVRFHEGFRRRIEYSPYPGCMKEVIFFLAECDTTETVAQECEVAAIRFLPYEEAAAAMTYESDRETLRLAHAFFKAHLQTVKAGKEGSPLPLSRPIPQCQSEMQHSEG